MRRDHCSGCKPAISLQVDSSFLPLLSSPNFKTDGFTRAEVFYAPLPSPSNQPKCENAKLASGLVRPSVCSVCMRSGGGNDVILLVVIKIIRVAGEIESYVRYRTARIVSHPLRFALRADLLISHVLSFSIPTNGFALGRLRGQAMQSMIIISSFCEYLSVLLKKNVFCHLRRYNNHFEAIFGPPRRR